MNIKNQDLSHLLSKTETDDQLKLFENESFFNWKQHWWGMPHFSMKNSLPVRKITVNFETEEDMKSFFDKLECKFTSSTDSIWFPLKKRLQAGLFTYGGDNSGDNLLPKYPLCLPSKGRADCQTTGKILNEYGIDYYFFVEETEADIYRKYIGEQRVISMPFHDLGQGSIPARNFIWDWAQKNNHKRHWVIDDNIQGFYRADNNRRLTIHGKNGRGLFKAIEDFSDRFTNVILSGPHSAGFINDRQELSPFILNTRIYSCILIDTSAKYRWRGRYNEDTDLSLRVLKDGFCTILFRALLMKKADTAYCKNKPMRGGNTDNVYNTGDYRKAFAESLKAQHPDCVTVIWRFNRWHHLVNYSRFTQPLIYRSNITKIAVDNEYGLILRQDKNLTVSLNKKNQS